MENCEACKNTIYAKVTHCQHTRIHLILNIIKHPVAKKHLYNVNLTSNSEKTKLILTEKTSSITKLRVGGHLPQLLREKRNLTSHEDTRLLSGLPFVGVSHSICTG